MKYSGKVMIEKVTEKTGVRTATKNPHARDNVNVAQGPRTGNATRGEKRSEFKSAKAEREPLAATIMNAYGARAQKDYVDPKLEPIRSDVKPKKFSR